MVTKPKANTSTLTVTINKAMTAHGSNTVFAAGHRFTTQGPLKTARNVCFDAQGTSKIVVAKKADLTIVTS